MVPGCPSLILLKGNLAALGTCSSFGPRVYNQREKPPHHIFFFFFFIMEERRGGRPGRDRVKSPKQILVISYRLISSWMRRKGDLIYRQSIYLLYMKMIKWTRNQLISRWDDPSISHHLLFKISSFYWWSKFNFSK